MKIKRGRRPKGFLPVMLLTTGKTRLGLNIKKGAVDVWSRDWRGRRQEAEILLWIL